MAPRRIEMLLRLCLVMALWGGTLAQSQSSCTNVFISLAPCLDYVTGNASNPSSSCCSQLAYVVSSQPLCLCEVVSGAASTIAASFNINQTRALALPTSCNIQTPPLTTCTGTTSSPFFNTYITYISKPHLIIISSFQAQPLPHQLFPFQTFPTPLQVPYTHIPTLHFSTPDMNAIQNTVSFSVSLSFVFSSFITSTVDFTEYLFCTGIGSNTVSSPTGSSTFVGGSSHANSSSTSKLSCSWFLMFVLATTLTFTFKSTTSLNVF
ncbi:hypothetical protein V8G54_021368 [Vigna mungo]|uniref:Bifunctional inhibitor/plant lipid transfer protein/seed storage helical domain-containing protein n=1 Tax=Vigna mungo TaxID=3915 RepID=A0AAQ3NE90_VIGMU